MTNGWISTSDNQIKFAMDVLRNLGGEAAITHGNVIALVAWMAEEGPVRSEEAGAAFNPMSTTKLIGERRDYPTGPRGDEQRIQESIAAGITPYGDPDDPNPHGVMDYPTWDVGVERTAATLRDSTYEVILSHLLQPGGTDWTSLNADPRTAGEFETWSTGGYSQLPDPAIFDKDPGHGEGGIPGAVTIYFTSQGLEVPAEDARPAGDLLDTQIENLGTSTGWFFEVTTPPSGPGPAPQTSTFYYALPILTDEPIAAGEDVAVYWRINGLPQGQEAHHTMERSQWNTAVVGNENWLASGDVIDPVFNEQGIFLTPDKDKLPINEVIRQLIGEAFLAGTEALNDPGIQRIIAMVVARPVMLEAIGYIKNLVGDTAWGQARTLLTANWDQATNAEKKAMEQRVLEDSQSGIYKQFQFYTSTFVRPEESLEIGGKTLGEWATAIAMGTQSYWDVGDAIKEYALALPGDYNNAWKRQVHDTQVADNQYQVDLDGKIQELKEAYGKWGLSPENYSWDVKALAQDILVGSKSMVEVMDDIRATAAAKFPGKPELLNTTDYALPWVNMYNEEMETPLNASHPLGNEDIMLALTSSEGESPLQFRTRLRGKDEWKNSRRAKELTADKMRTMESAFGFGGGVRRIV